MVPLKPDTANRRQFAERLQGQDIDFRRLSELALADELGDLLTDELANELTLELTDELTELLTLALALELTEETLGYPINRYGSGPKRIRLSPCRYVKLLLFTVKLAT
jgi:hypothetical protein